MSVASLTNKFHVVTVADEIESFVNVVLDQALHRIPHNYEDRFQKIMQYFEEFTYEGGVKSCGWARRIAMQEGKISSGNIPLEFGSPEGEIEPLGWLFDTMFIWFQARYKILNHEKRVASAAAGDITLPPTQRLRTESTVMPANKARNLVIMRKKSVEGPPSAAIRELAAHLNSHSDALDLFNMLLDSHDQWPAMEELRDPSSPSGCSRDPLPRPTTNDSEFATISEMPRDPTASSDVSTKFVPASLDRHPIISRQQTLSGPLARLGL